MEEIVEQIALRISRFEIPASQRLTEERLSRDFGVSRTPIREALRVLEQAGYIERTVPRGYAVRALNLAAIDDVFTVRIQLEDLSVALAARAVDTAAFAELKESALLAVNRLGPDQDHQAMRETFHEQLAALTANETLVRLLKDLDSRIFVTRRLDAHVPSRSHVAQEEHLRILELLESGRAEDARAAMREHIQRSQGIVRSLMASGISSVSFMASGGGE